LVAVRVVLQARVEGAGVLAVEQVDDLGVERKSTRANTGSRAPFRLATPPKFTS
jgi:hypothetical protein